MNRQLLYAALAIVLTAALTVTTYSSCSCDDDDDDDDTDDDETWTCGDEVCTDTANGLMWQKDTAENMRQVTWFLGDARCDLLSFAGYDDWRLPTLNELRTLILGCPDTETGGPCTATDECNQESCCNDPCTGCDESAPDPYGRFWRPGLDVDYGLVCMFWTNTVDADDPSNKAWGIDFFFAHVEYVDNTQDIFSARCVRAL